MKTGSKRQSDLPNITQQINGKIGFSNPILKSIFAIAKFCFPLKTL